MIRPDFERCTIEATKLLYKQDVTSRILNIRELTYDKKIIFDSIQHYSSLVNVPLSNFLSSDRKMLKDGCSIYIPDYDYYLVLYNDEVTYFEHLNWTLAHEVGHIYLGHKNDGDIEEIEAHYFASQLFMPEFSLLMATREYGTLSQNDIIEIFGVSPKAAEKRLATMKKKTSFNASQKSKEIWAAQRERVDLYFQCKADGSDYRNTLDFFLLMKEEYERECELERRLDLYSYI